MNRYLVFALCLGGAVACNSNSSTDAGTTPVDAGTTPVDAGTSADAGTDAGIPAEPALKTTEVDRMGRAGVNTALTDPFDNQTSQTEDAAKNAYNAQADRTQWVTDFSPEIASNLAVLDGLDGVCGNQLLAGATATAGRYNTLAGVLADDVLAVNSASGTCTTYLAVEANATGFLTNTDCGGRTPLYNTIDETYSLLAIGMVSGVTNGITMAPGTQASTTTFPFLAAPNP